MRYAAEAAGAIAVGPESQPLLLLGQLFLQQCYLVILRSQGLGQVGLQKLELCGQLCHLRFPCGCLEAGCDLGAALFQWMHVLALHCVLDTLVGVADDIFSPPDGEGWRIPSGGKVAGHQVDQAVPAVTVV